jgi:hypothetical protein
MAPRRYRSVRRNTKRRFRSRMRGGDGKFKFNLKIVHSPYWAIAITDQSTNISYYFNNDKKKSVDTIYRLATSGENYIYDSSYRATESMFFSTDVDIKKELYENCSEMMCMCVTGHRKPDTTSPRQSSVHQPF